MKILIPIVIGLLVVGCGKKETSFATSDEQKIVGTYMPVSPKSKFWSTPPTAASDVMRLRLLSNRNADEGGDLISDDFGSSAKWSLKNGAVEISGMGDPLIFGGSKKTLMMTPEGDLIEKSPDIRWRNVKKIVGTYENNLDEPFKIVFTIQDDARFQYGPTRNPEMHTGFWMLSDDHVQITYQRKVITGQTTLFRIDGNGSLTSVAHLSDQNRTSLPKHLRDTFLKIK
jgi:hypothetical protein